MMSEPKLPDEDDLRDDDLIWDMAPSTEEDLRARAEYKRRREEEEVHLECRDGVWYRPDGTPDLSRGGI
jgi:hypothetical protein